MTWNWLIWQINAVQPYVKEKNGRYVVVPGLITDEYTWYIADKVGERW